MKIVDIFFSTGSQRSLSGGLGLSVKIVSAIIAIWVVYSTCLVITDLFGYTIIFLSALLTLTFLLIDARPKRPRTSPSLVDYSLSTASIACGIYFFSGLDRIISRISVIDQLTTNDLVFGTLLLLLTIEATRRTTGLGLTAIVVFLIGYNLFGHYLNGILYHSRIDYPYFLDITVFTADGIFGAPLRVAATYAFLFILFGTFLDKAGGGEFFYKLGAIVTGRQVGGMAKIAIFSSGIYGTISGSPTSDVVTTGSVTIPLMKKVGYSPALAGAIEVVASSGGSIMPPVMGAVAFIMAEYTGIPYWQIALAAVVPALLYYFGVFTQVHLRSDRLGMRGIAPEDIPSFRAIIRTSPVFVIPLAVIITFLVRGYSPTLAAVFGTLSVLLVSLFESPRSLLPKSVLTTLSVVTLRVVPITAACAAAGLVIGGLSITGLSGKFSGMIVLMTGGYMLPALFAAAAFTILLGMGMPTPSAFILASVLVGPVLRDLGMSVMTSNMFLLYYSALSAMTPPVAVAAYAAAGIAQANPIHIAALSTRLAISAFVVPFTFAFGPELLLIGDPLRVCFAILTAIAGVFVLSIAAEGWWRGHLKVWVRTLLLGAGVCFVSSSLIMFSVGLCICGLVYVGGLFGQRYTLAD